MSVADIRAGLLAAIDGSVQVRLSQNSEIATCKAVDLAAALGLNINPTVSYPAKTTDSLHLRAWPSGPVLQTLAKGTQLDVMSTPTVNLSGLDWVLIQMPHGGRGWCALSYLAKDLTVPRVNNHRFGLHCLQDARADVEALFAKLPKQFQIAGATVVNDGGIATWLAERADYVVFRWVTGNGAVDDPQIPTDNALAANYGKQWTLDKLDPIKGYAGFGDLEGKNIYIQIANEVKYAPGHAGFWLGAMEAIQEFGMHAAIGAYSVATPEVADWQQLTNTLQYAKANGHIVALHAYTHNAAPGQLSAAADQPYWELRFPRLYAAVPADAQPDLVISEFGTEVPDFQSADALVSLARNFEEATSQYAYLKAYNRWTWGKFGGWDKSDVSSANDAVEAFLVG